MTKEALDYMRRWCGSNIEKHGYIFVKEIDRPFVERLAQRHPDFTFISRCGRGNHITSARVSFNNCIWEMRPLRLSDRGIRPRHLIVDMRIDDDILEDSCMLYNVGFCESIEFIPEE